MGNLELAITNLAEVTSNEIHHTNHTYGVSNLKEDVAKAGKITGKARKEIEKEIGRKVANKINYEKLTSESNKGRIKKVEN